MFLKFFRNYTNYAEHTNKWVTKCNMLNLYFYTVVYYNLSVYRWIRMFSINFENPIGTIHKGHPFVRVSEMSIQDIRRFEMSMSKKYTYFGHSSV
jgi:hypothetical protein